MLHFLIAYSVGNSLKPSSFAIISAQQLCEIIDRCLLNITHSIDLMLIQDIRDLASTEPHLIYLNWRQSLLQISDRHNCLSIWLILAACNFSHCFVEGNSSTCSVFQLIENSIPQVLCYLVCDEKFLLMGCLGDEGSI